VIKLNIPLPVTQSFQLSDERLSEQLAFSVITKGRNGLSFYQSIRKKALLAVDKE